MRVFLNGEFVDESQARVSIDDRGFLFADGVYEVVHVYNGVLFEWDRHWERLTRGLEALKIEGALLRQLRGAADQLVQEIAGDEAAVYIQVTRGVHQRSHLPPEPGTITPTVLLWVRPVMAMERSFVENGIKTITVADDRWAKVWIKTIGLLPNVLAKAKAHDAGAYEAIFVRDGMVMEASSANLFCVKNGQLHTAPVTNYILPGITRDVVLELAAALHIPVVTEPFDVDFLYNADEAFLTGTLTEVLPVTNVNGRQISQGAGPISRKLLAALHRKAGKTVKVG